MAETAIGSGQAAYFLTPHDLVTNKKGGRRNKRPPLFRSWDWIASYRPINSRTVVART